MAKHNNIGGFYRYLEWLMWAFYINTLWLVFTILGLVAFGLFPATAAMFAVYRQWFRRDVEDFKITQTFIETYKKEFFKSNGIGFILLAIGYVLYLDYQFLPSIQGTMLLIMQVALIALSIIYLILILHIFPVFVHFELRFFQYFKHAILIGIFSPLTTIAMVIGLVILNYSFNYIIGLLPAIGISLSAGVIMACALFAFNSIDKKQKKATGELDEELEDEVIVEKEAAEEPDNEK